MIDADSKAMHQLLANWFTNYFKPVQIGGLTAMLLALNVMAEIVWPATDIEGPQHQSGQYASLIGDRESIKAVTTTLAQLRDWRRNPPPPHPLNRVELFTGQTGDHALYVHTKANAANRPGDPNADKIDDTPGGPVGLVFELGKMIAWLLDVNHQSGPLIVQHHSDTLLQWSDVTATPLQSDIAALLAIGEHVQGHYRTDPEQAGDGELTVTVRLEHLQLARQLTQASDNNRKAMQKAIA